jgi:hypothetical protein
VVVHGDIAKVLEELDANRQDTKVLLLGVTDAQFNWKPEPQFWSMSECFTHMTSVIRLDLAEMKRVIALAKADSFYSTGPFKYGFISRWFVRSMEPPPKRRFKAPGIYVPMSPLPLEAGTREFFEALDDLSALVQEANGLDLVRIKVVSPVSKFIKMPLGARFLLLTAHNRRHLWQALQVKQHPRFGGA